MANCPASAASLSSQDGQRAAADVVCDAVMLGTPVSALDEAASAAGAPPGFCCFSTPAEINWLGLINWGEQIPATVSFRFPFARP